MRLLPLQQILDPFHEDSSDMYLLQFEFMTTAYTDISMPTCEGHLWSVFVGLKYEFMCCLCVCYAICNRVLYWAMIYQESGIQSQITKFMGPTWGPPRSCRPQVGTILAPWTLLSGVESCLYKVHFYSLMFHGIESVNHVADYELLIFYTDRWAKGCFVNILGENISL